MDIKSLPQSVRSHLRNSTNINSITQCVSELVLNSLDAKATAIAVRINFLKFQIQVVDNGMGVTKANMDVIGNRFMTSKCHCLEDLKKIKCFGFRGEALASIKGLCKSLAIISRAKDVKNSYSKTYKNLNWESVVQIKQRPSPGTTITIEGFLHNVPVRQKRINQNLDMENIRKMLETIAIIECNVSFTLRNDVTGKTILKSSKTLTVSQSLTNFYPYIQLEDLMEVKVKKGRVSVSGLICKKSTNNNKQQYVYLNKRVIHSTKIQKLANSLLTKSNMFQSDSNKATIANAKSRNEHPVYIINIRCPYTEVDLTLSPSKNTVEFKNWNTITVCITKAITKILENGNYINLLDKDTKNNKNELKQCKSQFGVSQMNGVVKSVPFKRKIVDDLIDKPNSQVKKQKTKDDLQSPIEDGLLNSSNEKAELSVKNRKRSSNLDSKNSKEGKAESKKKKLTKNEDEKTKIGSNVTNNTKNVKTRSASNKSVNFPNVYDFEVHRKRDDNIDENVPFDSNLTFLHEPALNIPQPVQDVHPSSKENENVELYINNDAERNLNEREPIPNEAVIDKESLANENQGKMIILNKFLKDSLQHTYDKQTNSSEQVKLDKPVEEEYNFPVICFGKPTRNSLNMLQFGTIECFRQTISHNITCITEHTKQPNYFYSEANDIDRNCRERQNIFSAKNTTDFTINLNRDQSIYRQSDHFSYVNHGWLGTEQRFHNVIAQREDISVPLYQTSNRLNFFGIPKKNMPLPSYPNMDDRNNFYNIRRNEKHFPFFQEPNNRRNIFNDPRENFTDMNNMPIFQQKCFEPNPLDFFKSTQKTFNSHLFNNNLRFECINLHRENVVRPVLRPSAFTCQFSPKANGLCEFKQPRAPVKRYFGRKAEKHALGEFKQPRAPVNRYFGCHAEKHYSDNNKRHPDLFNKNVKNLESHIFESENHRYMTSSYFSKNISPLSENSLHNSKKIQVFNENVIKDKSNFFEREKKTNQSPNFNGTAFQYFSKRSNNKRQSDSTPKTQSHTPEFLPSATFGKVKNIQAETGHQMINSTSHTRLFSTKNNMLNTVQKDDMKLWFEERNKNYLKKSIQGIETNRLWQQKSKQVPSFNCMRNKELITFRKPQDFQNQLKENNVYLQPSRLDPVFNSMKRNSRYKLSLKKYATESSKQSDFFEIFPKADMPKQTDFKQLFKKHTTVPLISNNSNNRILFNTDFDKQSASVLAQSASVLAHNTFEISANDSYKENNSLESFENFQPQLESTGILFNQNPNSEVIDGTATSFNVFVPSLTKFQSGNAIDRNNQSCFKWFENIQKGNGSCRNVYSFMNASIEAVMEALSIDGQQNNIKDISQEIVNNNLAEEDDWIKLTDDSGKTFYINKRTGMTSKSITKADSNFAITKRIDFVPKGLSPIFKESAAVQHSLSPKSKEALHNVIMESYQNELNTIKWSHYIDECGDVKKFFEELYLEKTKQFDKAIPNVNVQQLPRSMMKCYNNLAAESFTKDIFANMLVVGQVDRKFIAAVCRDKELLILFDQHAVHERVFLEYLWQSYKDIENPSILKSTKCQEPIFIELAKSDINILGRYQNLINALGLQFNVVDNGIETTHIPTCVYNKILKCAKKDQDIELKKFVESLLQEEISTILYTRGMTPKIPTVIHNIINSEACRGAIKFGDQLTFEECEELIEMLSKCDLPFQCAHGRPTITPVISLKQNNIKEKTKVKFENLKLRS